MSIITLKKEEDEAMTNLEGQYRLTASLGVLFMRLGIRCGIKRAIAALECAPDKEVAIAALRAFIED